MKNKTEILTLASRMIEIPSLSTNPEANRQVLDLASEFLGSAVSSRTFEHVDPETHNKAISRLWGEADSLLTPKLLLSGHIDVVGVDGDTSLFTPKVEGKMLMGRGAGDMKGHDAAMLSAYKRWIDEHGGAHGVGLLLTSDEEIGGANGTRFVISQGLKPDVVFIPDGSFDFDIVKSEKAPYHFVVSAESPGGHVSRAFKLDNPINRILGMYQEARDIFSIATQDQPWASTFEMTIINTPNESKNKIPNKVTAAFGWRWPMEQMDYETGKRQIQDLCKKYGLTIILEEGGGEGLLTDPNADFVKDWKAIIESVIDRNVGFTVMHGATDGRHFYHSNQFGSKKVLITSGITENHHEQGEWIDLDSLALLSEAIYLYAKKLTGSD